MGKNGSFLKMMSYKNKKFSHEGVISIIQ